MLIKNIEYKIKDVFLKEPIKVAFGTIKSFKNVFLKMELENNLVSYSEISNLEIVTKVDLKTVIKDLDTAINYLKNKDVTNYQNHIQFLNQNICMPSLCGIDNLLFDSNAKLNNVSLSQFLNQNFKLEKETNYTIGLNKDPKETIAKIQNYLDEYKTNIKLKTGFNVDSDIEMIQKIQSHFKNLKLRIDINQGYDFNDYKKFIGAVNLDLIELIEQPNKDVYFKDLKQMFDYNDKVYMLADESIHTNVDAQKLAEQKSCNGFNIKLIKCGGIANAIKIIKIAKEHNLDTMIGCMGETKLALSYAASLYLATNNMISSDLDSWSLINQDFVESKIDFGPNSIRCDSTTSGCGALVSDWSSFE